MLRNQLEQIEKTKVWRSGGWLAGWLACWLAESLAGQPASQPQDLQTLVLLAFPMVFLTVISPL